MVKRVKKRRKHNILTYAQTTEKLWVCTTTWILHDVLVRTKKRRSMHKGLTSMMSWPATAVVAYLNFFPSDVLSPVQMLKQAWMLFHTAVFNTTKERNQGMMGNEKGHTQGMNWSVEHAQTKIMKVELSDGRISSQRLRDSSSSSSRGASEQYM